MKHSHFEWSRPSPAQTLPHSWSHRNLLPPQSLQLPHSLSFDSSHPSPMSLPILLSLPGIPSLSFIYTCLPHYSITGCLDTSFPNPSLPANPWLVASCCRCCCGRCHPWWAARNSCRWQTQSYSQRPEPQRRKWKTCITRTQCQRQTASCAWALEVLECRTSPVSLRLDLGTSSTRQNKHC